MRDWAEAQVLTAPPTQVFTGISLRADVGSRFSGHLQFFEAVLRVRSLIL
jgi:hypothetical protein